MQNSGHLATARSWHRTWSWPEVGLWAAFLILPLAIALAWGVYLDESAYVTFCQARNLATGQGLNNNPTAPLRSPLYTLVLWLPARVGMSLPCVGLVLSALGWGVTATALYRVGRSIRRPAAGVAAAALVALGPVTVSTLGTETPWVAAWAWIAVAASLNRRWKVQTAALVLMMGIHLGPGTLALVLLLWVVQWTERRRFPLYSSLVLAIVALGWAWLTWAQLTVPLPGRWLLRSNLMEWTRSIRQALSESDFYWLFLPCVGLGLWDLARRRKAPWSGLLWGAVALLSGNVTDRALASTLGSFLAGLGIGCFARWVERTYPVTLPLGTGGIRVRGVRLPSTAPIVGLALIATLPLGMAQATSLVRRHSLRPVVYQALEGQAADWLRAHSDPTARILASQRLGYLAERPLLPWDGSADEPAKLARLQSSLAESPPAYCVSFDSLAWDRLLRTGWFQDRYASLVQFASPYDAASPLTIWGYRASPFDRGARRPLDVRLSDQADLIGFQYWPERIQPGDAVYVTLFWRATRPISRAFQTVVQLIPANADVVWAQHNALTPRSISLDDWQPGQVIAERFVVTTPNDLPVGAHHLAVHLTTVESHVLPLYREGDASPLDRASLGYVVVPLQEDARTALRLAQPVGAQVGNEIRLLGFEAADRLLPGTTLDVKLYWEVQQPPEEDYIVFVHLVDASGQRVASHDGPPMDRRYPTRAWLPGEVVPDVHRIPLDADAPSGTYRLQAGMYRWPSLERLPVWDEQDLEQPDRVIVLQSIRVP